jgi:hypothetical protein
MRQLLRLLGIGLKQVGGIKYQNQASSLSDR